MRIILNPIKNQLRIKNQKKEFQQLRRAEKMKIKFDEDKIS